LRRLGGPAGVVASVALALALVLAPAALFAEPREPREPVAWPLSGDGGREGPALDMRADELEIDLENRRAELRGNVELSRGDFKLKCAKVEIEYDEDLEVARARGTGGVVAEGKGVRGEAPEVVVDLAARTASLQGGVRVKQKNAVVLAERATVHLDSGRVVLYKVKGTLGGSGAGGAKSRAAPAPR
jgi:lipopolysaccharide export system protein LptA